MRRFILVLSMLLLLLVGGILTQQAVAEGTLPFLTLKSPLPELPEVTIADRIFPGALVFVVAVGFIVFNVIGMGVTLAIVTGRLSHQLSTEAKDVKLSEPSVPKSEAVPPGKPVSDRSALIVVAVAAVFGLAWALLRVGAPLPSVPETVVFPGNVQVPGLLLLAAVVGVLVGGTVVTGIGLARGTAVLHQELAGAMAAPPRPIDFRKLFVEPGLRLLKIRLTFVEQVLTCLDVALIGGILGIIGIFVVPSYLAVARLDQATRTASEALTPAPTAATGGVMVGSVEEVQAAFDALPAGDAAAGEAEFPSLPCASCHSLQPDVVVVGPSLAGVGTRAETRKPGYSSELYIFESIIRPNATVVQGFAEGVMPGDFRQKLSDEQIANLVAYLVSLK